ncbi:MAG: P22 phage major capsid protein family protein, partial [Oceanospirillum sp.]|nr:P22 phage major capsid protein family protein [Oceanospirillum sp.]
MANTLTDLIPDLYAALDKVSRELVGFIPAVGRNSTAERAAVGENVRVPITPTGNVSDIAPAMTIPEPTDQSVSNVAIQITKSRTAEFGYVGESQRGLNNGPGYMSVQANQILQAMRKLVNEVESDVAATYISSSRAYGTAGTTPFASDLSDTAQMHKILADNGAPLTDKQLIFDTTAGAKFRTLTQLTKSNENGSDDILRNGVLMDVHGFAIRESAQIKNHTKGTGTGYLVNNVAGYSEGDTVIAADTGTGTIVAGDIVTFDGDANKYLVTTALSGGSFTIAAPGLRQDLANDTAITVGGDYTANLAFDREAIQLVTRAPALPQEGDMAIDRMEITDPLSGLTFEVSVYPGYRKVRYDIALA